MYTILLFFLFSGHNEDVCIFFAEQSMDFRDLCIIYGRIVIVSVVVILLLFH